MVWADRISPWPKKVDLDSLSLEDIEKFSSAITNFLVSDPNCPFVGWNLNFPECNCSLSFPLSNLGNCDWFVPIASTDDGRLCDQCSVDGSNETVTVDVSPHASGVEGEFSHFS